MKCQRHPEQTILAGARCPKCEATDKKVCPKCGRETETDDNIRYQCTNLSCINAWFPFTHEEKVKT